MTDADAINITRQIREGLLAGGYARDALALELVINRALGVGTRVVMVDGAFDITRNGEKIAAGSWAELADILAGKKNNARAHP